MANPMKVDNPKTAAVFANSRQRRIVLILAGRELSLSQLSAATGTPLSLLHHHIGKLLGLNLVHVSRTEARAGRPVKFYRAVADAFFVPAELVARLPGEAQTARLRSALERSLSAGFEGILYSRDGDEPRTRIVRDPERRAEATELWLELRLSEADAASLTAEFRALLHRYEQCSPDARRVYIVHAAVARLKDRP